MVEAPPPVIRFLLAPATLVFGSVEVNFPAILLLSLLLLVVVVVELLFSDSVVDSLSINWEGSFNLKYS